MLIKMIKKILIMAFLIVFVVGCTGSNGDDAKIEKELLKGTKGVVLDVFSNQVPDEIYEGELLNYVVKVENKGPYSASGVVLVSVEKGFMEFGKGTNKNFITKSISLEGKTVFNTFDDFQIIDDIMINVEELDPLSAYHDSVILTSFCYDYKGIAIADVCIDTDPHDIRPKEKACKAQSSISLSKGQGGPVVIESVEPKMLIDGSSVRPQFMINVANVGKGTVISSGSTGKVCNSGGLSTDIYNAIKIDSVSLGTDSGFTCIPNELVLRKERDSITCTAKSPISNDRGAFQSPLEIQISYGYFESISKDIKIKNTLSN